MFTNDEAPHSALTHLHSQRGGWALAQPGPAPIQSQQVTSSAAGLEEQRSDKRERYLRRASLTARAAPRWYEQVAGTAPELRHWKPGAGTQLSCLSRLVNNLTTKK
ncbi:hypothetical protein AAFF_G00098350 [Aldrovandia affinis]|uniref:Uncharacterized protein n=1 Tax=Aldrovandia affinis TaxID=143900 RepID=A0AAD7WBW5_9TELE|nr:hypothetical protein AAFF_G00098350 [Aldrovandia affinis]